VLAGDRPGNWVVIGGGPYICSDDESLVFAPAGPETRRLENMINEAILSTRLFHALVHVTADLAQIPFVLGQALTVRFGIITITAGVLAYENQQTGSFENNGVDDQLVIDAWLGGVPTLVGQEVVGYYVDFIFPAVTAPAAEIHMDELLLMSATEVTDIS